MKKRAAAVVLTVLGLLSMAGCHSDEGNSMLTESEWTEARQQQIDLVTTVAHETSTDAYVVVESIGPCDSVDDLDETIASSNYLVTARTTPASQQTLDQVIKPRLEADGWTFRDRSNQPPTLDENTLDYLWTKSGAGLSVNISAGPDSRPAIQVSGSSPCGKRGGIRSGDIQRDDPDFLAPTVEGPTVDDTNRGDSNSQ